jgi:hypothetical protein
MVDTTFTLVSGTYSDEQDLLRELDFFMTQTVGGWVQATVITDTATDLQIAYYTDGSVVGFYDRCWVLLRGTADEFRLYGVSDWDGVSTTDGFGGNSDNIEVPVGAGGGTYWFMVNYDAVHVVIERDSDSNTYHCGCGHFVSYYSRQEDPKPFYVFGQTEVEQTFESAVRMQGYGPQSFGTSFSVLASGLSYGYEAAHPVLIAKGTPNPRSGEPKLIEPVFYTDDTSLYREVRGEVPGLYMCGGAGYNHGSFMTITGTLGTTAGNYFVHKHTDAVAWAIGPTTVSGEG